MDDFPADRLVAAGEALDLLAAEHDRRGTFGGFEVCRKQALETILGRLRNGTLTAWATGCLIDSTIDTASMAPGELVATWDFHHTIGGPAKVPREFWMHFHQAGEDHRSYDLVASDFSFSYVDCDYSSRDGAAYAVHFDQRGLPPIAVPGFQSGWRPSGDAAMAAAHGDQSARVAELEAALDEMTTEVVRLQSRLLHGSMPSEPQKYPSNSSPSAISIGRGMAEWWPDFVAELVAYVSEVGIPDGIGHQGQSLVLNEVSGRLEERDKAQPNRTQVQATINAVLRRMRSAGNS